MRTQRTAAGSGDRRAEVLGGRWCVATIRWRMPGVRSSVAMWRCEPPFRTACLGIRSFWPYPAQHLPADARPGCRDAVRLRIAEKRLPSFGKPQHLDLLNAQAISRYAQQSIRTDLKHAEPGRCAHVAEEVPTRVEYGPRRRLTRPGRILR